MYLIDLMLAVNTVSLIRLISDQLSEAAHLLHSTLTSDVRPEAPLRNNPLSNLRVVLLQPQNILLTSVRPLGDIRIVDFGLSRRMDNITEVREILGTPEYVGESNYQPLHRPLSSQPDVSFIDD